MTRGFDNMGFGEKLSLLRKQRGMTQMELAEKLDISRQAVSKWERGTAEPSIENMVSIGRVFDVSVDDLLDANLYHQDVPTVQVAVKERENESLQELREEQAEPVYQKESEKRRLSVFHVSAIAACVLIICIIACVILFAGRDQKELETDLVPIIPIEDLNQEIVEVPEEPTIVIVYDEP